MVKESLTVGFECDRLTF